MLALSERELFLYAGILLYRLGRYGGRGLGAITYLRVGGGRGNRPPRRAGTHPCANGNANKHC